jgi:DNA-binding transcriptional LysR family regulator
MAGPSSWEDQQAFLAVLESGSLSAAARQLGVTHATVRGRIETLEQRIGTVLFTRSAHGLVPTEQARSLGDAARTMARASAAFNRAAGGGPGPISGAVRISVSEFIGLEVLPAMLVPLREAHPELKIEIAISDRAVDLLDQEADVAVRMHRPQQATDMGGPMAPRTVEQGAASAVRLATLDWMGPTGGFYHDGEGPKIEAYGW